MKLPRLLQASLFVSLALGCGSDTGSRRESSAIATNLRACDLVSEGKLYPAVGDSDVARCHADCIADATCSELELKFCTGTSSDRLADCQVACWGPQSCDGGERRYDLRDRCDGQDLCDDGADEADCPEPGPRYCVEGGNDIYDFQRCDGVYDCKDGTDEKGCPQTQPTFTCKTSVAGIAQVIPQSQVCDLVPDCLDMSDEDAELQGCAQMDCGPSDQGD